MTSSDVSNDAEAWYSMARDHLARQGGFVPDSEVKELAEGIVFIMRLLERGRNACKAATAKHGAGGLNG